MGLENGPVAFPKETFMKVAIGSDHRGVNQRLIVGQAVVAAGHTAVDCGTFSNEPVDYPDIAAEVARRVANGLADRGILLCGTGIGVSIAANKIDGIRAAVCWDESSVRLSRQHNDANVLCLSSERFSDDDYHQLVKLWLEMPFEGGRHAIRTAKIQGLERI
jgi:ribose 5-phosphate isomerase B